MSKQSGVVVSAVDGIVAAPGFAFERAPSSGLYLVRDANGVPTDIGVSIGGVSIGSMASLASLTLKSKYQAAQINGVHMKASTDLVGLAAVDGTIVDQAVLQTTVNTQLNLLQASAAAHAASLGTATVDGAHLGPDAGAATLAAIPVASSLATSKTLVAGLFTWLAAHGAGAGTHFHDDATAAAVTVGTNATLANVVTNANTILAAMQAHYALASV